MVNGEKNDCIGILNFILGLIDSQRGKGVSETFTNFLTGFKPQI